MISVSKVFWFKIWPWFPSALPIVVLSLNIFWLRKNYYELLLMRILSAESLRGLRKVALSLPLLRTGALPAAPFIADCWFKILWNWRHHRCVSQTHLRDLGRGFSVVKVSSQGPVHFGPLALSWHSVCFKHAGMHGQPPRSAPLTGLDSCSCFALRLFVSFSFQQNQELRFMHT